MYVRNGQNEERGQKVGRGGNCPLNPLLLRPWVEGINPICTGLLATLSIRGGGKYASSHLKCHHASYCLDNSRWYIVRREYVEHHRVCDAIEVLSEIDENHYRW